MSAFYQYREFVSALFAPTDTVCFAAIQEGQAPKHSFMSAQDAMTESCFESLVEANETHSIYIAMNSFRPELEGKKKGRTKENVAEIKRLYIDADSNGQAVLDEVRSGSIVPLPNVILETSPDKFQFIWNVEGLTKETAEPLLKALAQEFGTDPAVAEIARVLRVPGLRNRKYPDAPEVKVVGEISSRVYQISDFKVAYKPTETIPEREVAPRDENNKIPHRFLYHFLIKEAGRLRSAGYTVEQIRQILPMWAEENCAPPLDFKKIDSYALAATPWEQGSPTGGELFLNQQSSQAQTAAPTENCTEVVTVRASDIKPKAIEWLWQYRIPMNKLSILAGNPDQGKSLVSLYFASQVSRDLPLYGDSAVRVGGEVLILAAEDEADDTIVPRLEAAGADLRNVHILSTISTKDAEGLTQAEREARLDVDLQRVENFLIQNPSVRLVIIDPISSFLGAANMNKEQEVRSVLTPLKNMASRRQVAVVCVMHLNKTTDQSAIHRIGGAVAFTGVARAVWLFMQDATNKDNHQMLRVKNNIAKATGGLVFNILTKDILIDGKNVSQPFIHFVGETESSASDLLLSSKLPAGRPPVEIQNSAEWLEDFLSNGPEAVADIESAGKKAKHTKGTLDRAKKKLGVEAFQDGRKWWWKLPDQMMAVKQAALAANTKSLATAEN